MKQQIYFDGTWYADNPPIMGPTTHSIWMGTAVFDGARAFRGRSPDLDLHCQRLIRSARAMGLTPPITAAAVEDLVWQGIHRFPAEAELFIRPMIYAEDGFVLPDPDSARFTLTIAENALPAPTGFTAGLSPFRRPAPNMATTDAKAACLYPNAIRAIREANERGFDTAIMLDPDGDVAEFATANIFITKDGVVRTPVNNRTFLNGITRQRIIGLLREDGHEVAECRMSFDEVCGADEVFSTGNLAKVLPTTRVEDRDFQPGPVMERARELYFAYAETTPRR